MRVSVIAVSATMNRIHMTLYFVALMSLTAITVATICNSVATIRRIFRSVICSVLFYYARFFRGGRSACFSIQIYEKVSAE